MKDLFGKKVEGSAIFSPCRKWRYKLSRSWGSGPLVMFIGLNPSTADEIKNDPTINRCIGFARKWNYSGIIMSNIFAFRATDPNEMKEAMDPVGPETDFFLKECSEEADMVIACWGVCGAFMDRGNSVKQLIPKMKCFGLTKGGFPKHPLYLNLNTNLVMFE